MKINKFSNDLPKEIVAKIKGSVAIDTEATGLKIPERDKLSLIQLCDASGNVYVIQPDRKTYKAPNLVSILEDEKILKIGGIGIIFSSLLILLVYRIVSEEILLSIAESESQILFSTTFLILGGFFDDLIDISAYQK